MADNLDQINLTQAGTLSPEMFAQQQALNRQQQLASMLLQNNQQPQGQMISGRYVAPAWTQMLQPVANMLTGAYLAKQGDTKAAELAQQLRGQQEQDISKFSELMKTDPNAAYQFASKSYVPQLREAGLKKMMPEEITLGEGQKRFMTMPDGSVREVASGGEKLHSVGKNLVTSAGKVVYSAPLTGEEKANPQEAGLRSSFFNQAQPHIAISQAYRKIDSAPETAAGDMSRIFGYMKILDPGSTVREGEYASAENARGVPSSIQAQYNKVLNGQRLTPQQRTEFTQSAGDIVNSQKQQFESQKKYYSDVASHYKIAPQNIIYDPYADLSIRTTPPKTPKGQVNPAQQLNIPQAGDGNAGWNIIGVTPTKK
ncbi:MAG: hypothetical protein WCO38_09425 [Verrucomicrobiota bacterium]